MLEKLDLARLRDQAQAGERVVRKLRVGMMPPSGMPRPDQATRAEPVGFDNMAEIG
jgi:hypothetical protein